MASLNKVMLIGNLGKDPEIRQVPNGDSVANFNIAITEKYTNKAGEKVETTEWVTCVLWRKLAEIAEKYLKQGSSVYVEGKIKTRSWDDNDGNKRYTTEVTVHEMQMFGGKKSSSEEPGEQQPQEEMGLGQPDPDELPF